MAGNLPLSALVKKGQESGEGDVDSQEAFEKAKQLSHVQFFLDRDDIGERLGGGLPRRALVTLKGDYGTGKSIICQRLLYGILRNNHTATYISTELTIKGFLDQMFSLRYNIAKYLLKGRLQFFSLHQLAGSSKVISDPLAKLERATNIFNTDVLIVDTLSALAPENLNMERISKLLSFFKRTVASGLTIVMAVEKGEISERELLPFYTACEVLMDLDQKLTPMGTLNFLTVVRFSGALKKVSTDFAFRVEPNIGIVPEITDMA